MKNLTLVGLSISALVAFAGCGGAESLEPQSQEAEPADTRMPIDAVAASPSHYRVMLDNDFVRVLRVRLPPGERDEMHTHPRNAWYSLSEGTMRLHAADGSTTDVPLTVGQVGMNLAEPPHARENVGETDLELILVERKQRPTRETAGADALTASPDMYSLLAENADFRVIDVDIPPGAADQPHGHRSSVFYILSDSQVLISPTGGEPFSLDFTADSFNFQEVENEHTLENTGDTDIRIITFEFER